MKLILIAISITFLLMVGLISCLLWFGRDPATVNSSTSCFKEGYLRFDVVENGKFKPVHWPGDGSPIGSITSDYSDLDAVRSLEEFFNETELVYDCDQSLESASRKSFVEFRSAALTQYIQNWQNSNIPESNLHHGNLLTERTFSSYIGSHPRDGRIWDTKYALADAPSWLPKEQLNEKSFIAFWGDGHLFKGSLPNQYFWIGFRL